MEWQTEAVDQNAHPLPDAVATLVREMPAIAREIPKAEVPPAKAATLRAILRNVREQLDNALKLLEDGAPMGDEAQPETPKALSFTPVPKTDDGSALPALAEGDRVVEGVFDGMGMVGGDGKSYLVPPNYASKSKLVEGDMLKLTIGARGNFIYKQIGPIERQRIIGTLAYDQETGQYLVVSGGRSWKVLKASITYFKADAGDEAVILAPKNAPSKWAAVENVIRKTPAHPTTP